MRSLFVAASGMSAQQTRIDTIANNLANISTTGYKKSRESFEDAFYQELSVGGKSISAARIDVGAGVRMSGLEKNHASGTITVTGNSLDVALNGNGYFMLETVEGDQVYTRDGSFTRDRDGMLISKSGLTVSGNIVIPIDAEEVHIQADGTVAAKLVGDIQHTTLGQLEVASFVNAGGLRPIGGNLYEETDASGTAQVVSSTEQVQVIQGSIENSNVDVAEELIQMILAQRAYELNSKVVKAADETLQMAANLKR
jgi:flagellar basal-body rod protein FlgG